GVTSQLRHSVARVEEHACGRVRSTHRDDLPVSSSGHTPGMTVTTACWSAWPEPPRHFLSSRNDKKPLRSRRSIRLSVTTFGATAEGLSVTCVFGLPTAGAARVHRRRRAGRHLLLG